MSVSLAGVVMDRMARARAEQERQARLAAAEAEAERLAAEAERAAADKAARRKAGAALGAAKRKYRPGRWVKTPKGEALVTEVWRDDAGSIRVGTVRHTTVWLLDRHVECPLFYNWSPSELEVLS